MFKGKMFKEFTNPSCSDEVISSSTLIVDELLFRIVKLKQTEAGSSESYEKTVLAVDLYSKSNSSVRIQQDWIGPEDLKKLGEWLIENAKKLEVSDFDR